MRSQREVNARRQAIQAALRATGLRDEKAMMSESRDDTSGLGRLLIYSATLSLALFGGVAWLRANAHDVVRNARWIAETYPACITFALLIVAGGRTWRHRDRLVSQLPLACVLFTGLMLLFTLRVTGGPSWDYGCYLRAGQAIWQGQNIYQISGYHYIYSPVLATLFSAVEALPAAQQEPVSFFIWQTANYWATLLFMLLFAAVLRRYKVDSPFLWPLLAVMMLVNVPLQRTLFIGQVNTHILNLLLGYLLLSTRYPILGGGLLGIAAIVKTSPILLLFTPLWERRVKPIAGAIIGGGALAAASIAVVGLQPWRECLPRLLDLRSGSLYRDNSVQSLFLTTSSYLGLGHGNEGSLFLAKVLTLGMVVGLLWWATQPKYRALFAGSEENVTLGAFPILLVAMVIASPLVWEHHWVFLQLPFCLLVYRAWGTRFALPALFSYALVFFIPTFDMYPLSYHRLAGLVWWAILVHAMVKQGAAENSERKRKARVGV